MAKKIVFRKPVHPWALTLSAALVIGTISIIEAEARLAKAEVIKEASRLRYGNQEATGQEAPGYSEMADLYPYV